MLRTKNYIPLISSPNAKKDRVLKCGIEKIISVEFNGVLAQLSPQEFFENYIIKELNAKIIVCGYNYTFGRQKSGDINTLKELCKKNNIWLEIVQPVAIGSIIVSSTLIRDKIPKDIKQANQMLGYNYYILQSPVSGAKIGSTLGYPTINQQCFEQYIYPSYGVYVTITDDKYKSVTNVGVKPTLFESSPPVIETYIIDSPYIPAGDNVKVEFIEKIRQEQKFASVGELKKQIAEDVVYAVRILN